MTEWHLDGVGVVGASERGVSIALQGADAVLDIKAADARSLGMALLDAADAADGIAGCL